MSGVPLITEPTISFVDVFIKNVNYTHVGREEFS